MKRSLKTFISIGLAVVFTFLFTLTARASLFEHEPYLDLDAHLTLYAEIEGSWERGTGAGGYALDVWAILSTPEVDAANRRAEGEWSWSYEFTDVGFSLYNTMSVSTSYEYYPEQAYFYDVGYAYAYNVWAGWISSIMLRIPPTEQLPAGTVIPFAIQTETWGDPWVSCDWKFTMAGITVNQDDYDQVIFNLEVDKFYIFFLDIPRYGMETQKVVDGYLESGFGFHFSRVPIPGAIWLLGSGLIGVIGLRRRKSQTRA